MSQTSASELFDWASVEPSFQKLLEEDLTPERIPQWLLEWSRLEEIVYETFVTLQRAKHENTADEIADKSYLNFIENVQPKAKAFTQRLTNKLLDTSYQPLPEHQEMLKRFRADKEIFREENLALHQKIETLINQFQTLNGSLMVKIDDEEMTTSQAYTRLFDADREVREKAWRAGLEAQQMISKEADAIFFEIITLRQQIAHNANLNNFRDYAWKARYHFDYTVEDALSFIDAVEQEIVPVLADFYQQKKSLLRIDTLRPWDMYFDPKSREPLKPFNTPTELEDGLERIFTNLDPVLGKQFSRMRQGWMDLEDRPNKLSGIGYCDYFPLSKMPYIYHSLYGLNLDVWVMLHEMGHAFQVFAFLDTQPLIWNHWAGPEFSEVASQAMELLALPYYEKSKGGFYSSKDTQRAREEQLIRVLKVCVNVTADSAFQHWLYDKNSGTKTLETIDQKSLELSRRFYPFVDWSGLDAIRGKGWQTLSTFANPFYDLDYAIAYLGAIQIWQNSLKDPKKALGQYRYALSLGASRSLPELFEAAGAKFAFDRLTLRNSVQFVKEQLEG